MKNKTHEFFILMVVLLIINAIVMPNYQFWINAVRAHQYAAILVLVLDVFTITIYLPSELTKIYYARRKKTDKK